MQGGRGGAERLIDPAHRRSARWLTDGMRRLAYRKREN
jgi:hypothetical protein